MELRSRLRPGQLLWAGMPLTRNLGRTPAAARRNLCIVGTLDRDEDEELVLRDEVVLRRVRVEDVPSARRLRLLIELHQQSVHLKTKGKRKNKASLSKEPRKG